MHFNFGFTTVQVLWTLTFAALLVLLVVLLGRDRSRRFPWFTASMALTALRLLASRMLFERMPPMATSSIFLTLAILEELVSLAVLVELARRAFSGATRSAWIIGALAMLAGGAAVLATWGPWPPWKTLTAESTLAVLRLMQLVAQKTDLLADVLTIELGVVVMMFGRRFKAGWRSHTQQIVIGLQEKLYNSNSVVFLAVLVWFIVCLWIDEPGTGTAAAGAEALPAEADGVGAAEKK